MNDIIFSILGCGGRGGISKGRDGGPLASVRGAPPKGGDITGTWEGYEVSSERLAELRVEGGAYNADNPYVDSRWGKNMIPLESTKDWKKRISRAEAWEERKKESLVGDARDEWMADRGLGSDPWTNLDASVVGVSLLGLTPRSDRDNRPDLYVKPTDGGGNKNMSTSLYKSGGVTIIVTGSREYDNYNKILGDLRKLSLDRGGIREIIHGGARGADSLVERAAQELGIPTKIYIPEWRGFSGSQVFNRGAGHQRSSQMIWENVRYSAKAGGARAVGGGAIRGLAYFAGAVTPGTAGTLRKFMGAGMQGQIVGISADQMSRIRGY